MSLSSLPTRRALLAAALLAVLSTATGCLGDSSGPMQPATTGSIQVSASFSSGGAPSCTDSSTYTYTPISLTGTEGTATTVVHHLPGATVFPTNGRCPSSDLAPNLRLGTWRVNWSVTPSSCTVDIHTVKWVRFNESLICSPG